MINPQTGKKGPPSQCDPYREAIKKAYENGMSIERIHADLVSERGFEGEYFRLARQDKFTKLMQCAAIVLTRFGFFGRNPAPTTIFNRAH